MPLIQFEVRVNSAFVSNVEYKQYRVLAQMAFMNTES